MRSDEAKRLERLRDWEFDADPLGVVDELIDWVRRLDRERSEAYSKGYNDALVKWGPHS